MPADSFVRIWKFIARPKQSLARHCRQAATTLSVILEQRSAIRKRKIRLNKVESSV